MGRRYFDSDEDHDLYWADQKSTGRCTCHVGFNWEYGPCDYCTSPDCHECGHEECPSDCYCECNENVDPDDE